MKKGKLALFSLFFIFTIGMNSGVKAKTISNNDFQTQAQSKHRLKDMMKTVKNNENKKLENIKNINEMNKKVNIEITVIPKNTKTESNRAIVVANSHSKSVTPKTVKTKKAKKNDQLPRNFKEFGKESEFEVIDSWENLSSSLRG